MSYIVTNTTTIESATVQQGETADIQASIGDTLWFSGGGWYPWSSVEVQIYQGGWRTIKTIQVDNSGAFISNAYPITSDVGTGMLTRVTGLDIDGLGYESGRISLKNAQVYITFEVRPTTGGRVVDIDGNVVSGFMNYPIHADFQLTAYASQGYNFVWWKINSVVINWAGPTFIYVANDGDVIEAVFSQITYALTATTNGTGVGFIRRTITGAINEGPYPPNTVVTLEAVPANGSVFAGWGGALSGISNPTTITMNANKSISATFTKVGYTLTITHAGTGSGTNTRSPNLTSYDAGTVVTITALPDSTSVFVGWSGDVGGTNPVTALTMNADRNVTATFTRAKFALTVSASAGGQVSKNPSKTAYDLNDIVVLTAIPRTGYTFAGWGGDFSGTSPELSITITKNITVTATFTPANQFSLIVNYVGQGTVVMTPGGGSYNPNTVVTLQATPAQGWTFVGWSGTNDNTKATTTVMMTSNKNATVTFKEIGKTDNNLLIILGGAILVGILISGRGSRGG